MAIERSNTLEELLAWDRAVDRATDLNLLNPIIYRLDEIARENVFDEEVQIKIGDIMQHISNRGKQLQEPKPGGPDRPAHPPHFAPPVTPPRQDDSTGEQTTMTFPPPKQRGDTYARPPTVPGQPGPAPVPLGSPPAQPGPPPAKPASPGERKGSRTVKVATALIAGLLGGAILAVLVLKRVATVAKAAPVALQIATVPPGASVSVNGEAKCVSDCSVLLPPGNRQIAAALDGYEPWADSVTLVAGQPQGLKLILQPQPQTVRIHADFAGGSVIFDNQLPTVLQNGGYTFENVKPGAHAVKVMSSSGETSFMFDLAPAKLPAVRGTVAARDVLTVLVASFANHARVVTSSGPWKLAVNGHAESDAGPAGVDLQSFDRGDNELVIGEGNDRRRLKDRFDPAPALTVFVTTDPNAGTLIVSTGENGVHVFLNDREYPLRTRNGEIRIQTVGPVAVRVSKDGFQEPGAQIAQVKKGSEVRLEFKMVALPPIPPPP